MQNEDLVTQLSERRLLMSLSHLHRQNSIKFLSTSEEIVLDDNLKSQMDYLVNFFSQFKPKSFITEGKGTCLMISDDNVSIFYGTVEGRLIGLRFDTSEIFLNVSLRKGAISCISLFKATSELLVGLASGEIIVYNATDYIQKQILFAHKSGVTGICSAVTEFFSTGNDGRVISWKVGSYDQPITIFTHNKEVSAIDISKDNKYLATGGDDCLINIYDISTLSESKEILNSQMSSITCLKFSSKSTFIAAGDITGKVFVFEASTLKKLHILEKHLKSITSIETDENELNLISSAKDGKIIIWSLFKGSQNLIELEGHQLAVNSIKRFEKSQMFCSISKDLTIKTWGIPNFNHYYVLDLDIKVDTFVDVFVGKSEPSIFYLMDKNEIVKVNRVESTSVSIDLTELYQSFFLAINKANGEFCVTYRGDELMTKKKKLDFFIHSLDDFKVLRKETRKCSGIHSMIYSLNGLYLITGERNQCSVIVSSTFETFHVFTLNRNPIEYLSISKNSNFLISAGLTSSNVKLYDIPVKQVVNIYEDETFSNIKRIVFSNDEHFFVVLSENKPISVWTILKRIKISSLDSKGVTDIQFHSQNEFLYILRENSLESFDFPSFTKSFQISFNEKVDSFTFTQDLSEIIIKLESRVEIWKSPLMINSLAVYGDNSKLYSYYKYLGKVVSGSHDSSEGFESWIIEPFHMNTSHIFAYLNRIDLLSLSIEEGSSFVNSRKNFSPLNICLEMNNDKGIAVFLKYLKTKSQLQPFLTNVLKHSVNKLLEHESFSAKEILDLILLKAIDGGYSLYTTQKLPIISFQPTFLNVLMQPASENSLNVGKKVEYLQTYFKINLAIGSNDSLSFLRALESTKNEETYNCQFIQMILTSKWEESSKILILQAIFYSIYLLLVSLYTILRMYGFLVASFVVSIFLTIYELFQMRISFNDYIKDGWNIIDMLRCIWMFIVFILIANSSPISQSYITGFLIFISWVRGIGYFRIISYTRYYVRLIYYVIIDIIPFITILLYTTLAFSVIIYQITLTNDAYSNVLAKSWEMNLGSFDVELEDWGYFSFAIYIMFNPIIMLTLLVSIMSYTFERLNNNVKVADGYALCKMIIEIELLYFWRRKFVEKTFLHVGRSFEAEASNDTLIEQIDEKIKDVGKAVYNLSEDVNQKFENFDAQIKEMRRSQKEIKNNQIELQHGQNEIINALNQFLESSRRKKHREIESSHED